MSIKETSSGGPKAGDRIIPLGSERYFLISRVYSGKAHYLWTPGEDTPFQRGEDRSVRLRDLRLQSGGVQMWEEVDRTERVEDTASKWRAKINWSGALEEYETIAKSEKQAKVFIVNQIAKDHKVTPGVVLTRLSAPGSFSIGKI